jgi:tRNA (adenine-N(1)-)-methyltransferase non-catalytic subunit
MMIGNGAVEDDPYADMDPLPPRVREFDHVLLHFADGKQVFAQAAPTNKRKHPCKIKGRTYTTHDLIGLSYGTVLEVGKDRFVPLDDGEDLLPNLDVNEFDDGDVSDTDNIIAEANGDEGLAGKVRTHDNRNLIDDNKSQSLSYETVEELRKTTAGADVVAALIRSSATFASKTAFSKAKYVKRKQMKYQTRCRIVRITPQSLCNALFLKDKRRMSNLREDTLGQILGNANISAGQRILVMDNAVMNIITASCVRRMGGYGSVFSLYEAAGSGPGFTPGEGVIDKMNLTVMEKQSLKWVNAQEVFCDQNAKAKQNDSLRDDITGDVVDVERRERELIQWPLPLQDHTRDYILKDLKEEKKISNFLADRAARFARKLTRYSALELRVLIDESRDKSENYEEDNNDDDDGEKIETIADVNGTSPEAEDSLRQFDSLIIATKYDPTTMLFRLLPYLAPSCPFVIYHEFIEPLLQTFHALQNHNVSEAERSKDDEDIVANKMYANVQGNTKKANDTPIMARQNIAINLRLTDTWFREYQVLEGRTHPNMNISQSGGYILMGTKLCPRAGTNEMDETEMRELRTKLGGRRIRQKGRGGGGARGKRKTTLDDNDESSKKTKE